MSIHSSPAVEEGFNDWNVPQRGGKTEGRSTFTVVAADVGVGAGLQQNLEDREMAFTRCHTQRRLPLLVLLIPVCRLAQESNYYPVMPSMT